jgi:hypothetical protein
MALLYGIVYVSDTRTTVTKTDSFKAGCGCCGKFSC